MRTPSIAELLTAVRERMDAAVEQPIGGFEARVVRNVLLIVERELELGPDVEAANAERCRHFGAADDADLAAAIRRGEHDDRLPELITALEASATDRLRIDNPRW